MMTRKNSIHRPRPYGNRPADVRHTGSGPHATATGRQRRADGLQGHYQAVDVWTVATRYRAQHRLYPDNRSSGIAEGHSGISLRGHSQDRAKNEQSVPTPVEQKPDMDLLPGALHGPRP